MTPRLILLLALATGIHGALAAEPTAPVAPATTPGAPRPTTPAPGATGATTASAATPRNESSVVPSASFDAFRLITERNIFNPNRSGRRDRTVEEAPPRLDVITLVGTMDSDQGGLRAFFDGSEAGFRKVLHVGESVDKFKVTKIAPQNVDLERDGKTVSIRVGQQFRRPEGADWNLAADLQPRSVIADPARVDPNAPPVIPANADDVTRRLMERRAKALKN